MCEESTLHVPSGAYEKMPLNIDSDDPLFNVGKKDLFIALRMAHENRWVAEWLFKENSQPFHKQSTLPPEAFHNSLAIHLHNDISTPGQCPSDTQPLDNNFEKGPCSERADTKFTVTKDIDLLLVPVANVSGLTVGYTFMKSVQEAAYTRPLFPPNRVPGATRFTPSLISGRFAFEDSTRDFLMVVNGMSPHLTGIVSMRWPTENTRDRSFFAVPKSEYGPDHLPSRVLSVQCNVDREIPSRQHYQFDTPYRPDSATRTDSASSRTDSTTLGSTEDECYTDATADDNDALDMLFTTPEKITAQLQAQPPVQNDWFPGSDIEMDIDLATDLADGLESIGTVLAPDQADLLPALLQDFGASERDMEDMERLFNDDVDMLASGAGRFDSPLSQTTTISPVSSSETSSSVHTGTQLTLSAPAMRPPSLQTAGSWLVSGDEGATPDGVGIPRVPDRNDTSSGSFNMSALLDSLGAIERSMKGSFFSPKVRKDILHPQTGELLSRCTGELTSRNVDIAGQNLSLFRQVAAQTYYSSLLSVSNDTRLITAHPPIAPAAPPAPSNPFGGELLKQTESNDARKVASLAPAALAPRPVAPRPTPVTSKAGDKDDEAAKEAKLEAKRIKNRMSAAKSNQKRRAQLESQRKELAVLRKRVEELKAKKQHMTEENESLRRLVLET